MLKNIVVKNSETMLIYQKFRVVEDFFKYPLKSSVISINCVSDLSSKLFIGTLSDYLSVKMLHCLITVDMQFFHFSIENTFCWSIVSNVFNVCTVVVAIITSPLAAVSRRRYSSGHGLSLDYLLAGNLRLNFHDIWGTHRLWTRDELVKYQKNVRKAWNRGTGFGVALTGCLMRRDKNVSFIITLVYVYVRVLVYHCFVCSGIMV